MNNLGEQVTDHEVEEMIREADADGDGELSFDDFLQFIQKKGLI
jgi:calmodulin